MEKDGSEKAEVGERRSSSIFPLALQFFGSPSFPGTEATLEELEEEGLSEFLLIHTGCVPIGYGIHGVRWNDGHLRLTVL